MPDYSGHLLGAKTLAGSGRSILGQYGQAREGDLSGDAALLEKSLHLSVAWTEDTDGVPS